MQDDTTELDLAVNDLGPLAWVLDELRKSLDTAASALRRFVRDAEKARGSDMVSVDTGQLRIARQQLHQAVGALEMVGLGAPAQMLRAMESAAQKFVEQPQLCREPAATKVERAGFALTEYLEALLLGKPVSAVALFPQYRDVQEIAGADRIHPADLWVIDWRWLDPDMPLPPEGLIYGPQVRGRLDQAVLKVVKTADGQAAHQLMGVSLGLAAGQNARQPRIFWKICAAYFEAVAKGLLPDELYVKRAASRILMQYATLAKGDTGVSDRLAQDLLFFCTQAQLRTPEEAPLLAAVRKTWNLARFKPVDYQQPQFGRFDPTMLLQARKRIAAARETWSALSGGDANKLKGVADQFGLVSDSLVKLHAGSTRLAHSMNHVMESTVRAGQPPSTELAMEVATAVLYLEAAFEDLDPTDPQFESRTNRLAERLDAVRAGRPPEALEPWMEELYRRVSDRQTMGSVVGELRGTLAELEKLLDQFFRNPKDKAPLRDAPSHLAQMRGVLSVLGLDQAAQAVVRMRESVEEIMVTELDEEKARAAGTFDKLGNNMGALGFLIDMLNYQPALAKKLFVYDDALGELKPLMGRTSQNSDEESIELPIADIPVHQEVQSLVEEAGQGQASADLSLRLDSIATHAALSEQPALAQSARQAAAAMSASDAGAAAAALTQLSEVVQPVVAPPAPPAMQDPVEEDDLQDIFLEEAREVVQTGLAALATLDQDPVNTSELTTLRRAFHTLKGSSRMVGLTEFGEGAWSMEQVLNTWLADQKPATEGLRSLCRDAMQAFGRWTEDIAAGNDAGWTSAMFRGPADAWRVEQRLVTIGAPGLQPAPEEVPVALAGLSVPDALPDPGFSLDLDLPEVPPAEAAPTSAAAAIEFDLGAPSPEPAVEGGFDFDLPDVPATSVEPEPALSLDFSAPAPAGNPWQEPAPPEIAGIDFDSLASVASLDPGAPVESVDSAERGPVTEAVELTDLDGFDFDLSSPEDATALAPLPDPVTEVPVMDTPTFELPAADEPVAPVPGLDTVDLSASAEEEQVRVIGSLRIGIPLYNVYLNEADEWSRRLVTEVGEWALESSDPVPESSVGLAHALAGASATVGFHSLSDLARALEHAMWQAQGPSGGLPAHAQAFVAAAEEMRRLLHQFAAGFLKDPDPQVLAQLEALKDLPPRSSLPAADTAQLDDPVDVVEIDFAPAPELVVDIPPLEVEPEPQSWVASPAAPAEALVAAPSVVPAPLLLVPEVARPAVVRSASDGADEDIDLVDAMDPDLFPVFEEEAMELMPALGGALRQWAARTDNMGARDEVLRALHTIKGSARLAGALRMGEMAHRMESEIESMGSAGLQHASQFEPLLQRFDSLQVVFDTVRARGAQPEAAVEALAAAPVAMLDLPQAMTAAQLVPAGVAAMVPEAVARVAQPAVTVLAPTRSASNQLVRVRSQLLDRLVNQAGEVMITRTRLEAELGQLRSSLTDLTGNLDRLRHQLRDIELQAESQMQSRLAQAKDSAAGFDPLEFDRFTRVQELTRMMAESVNDVATVQRNLQRTVEATEDDLIAQARQTRELQRDLLRTRMVEFEGISERLYRVVRLASKETGKQVRLEIVGGSIEMDRGVLDRMTPAFEHLLRNCVAHGIEDPAVRGQSGKDATGTIGIRLSQEGNDVSVEFRDDGAGLPMDRIRQRAIQQGLIAAEQALTPQEAAALIFMPGFSTATTVTELSGRGIGMDVVRAEVNALGGRIETNSEPGRGTSFKLVLPLTTAVTQVVMLRCGALSIGVPAYLVEIVRRAAPAELESAYATGGFDVAGETLPFYWSGALLQTSARSADAQAKTLPVVIFRSAAQRLAMHVDEVLGNQEVVVKNLGPQLARLPGLAGMTVLASGAVVLIYNPVALGSVYGEQARRFSAERKPRPVAADVQDALSGAAPDQPGASMQSGPTQVPLVMVVDDSITVRRVTQRLLQREGYRVVLAADGLQALERLADELPTVVLSDIEMPRMDGFDLARNIRSDARLKHLPIIMITSRIAEKHREHAMELGVNNYLGKPYSEDELLGLVRMYCSAEVPA